MAKFKWSNICHLLFAICHLKFFYLRPDTWNALDHCSPQSLAIVGRVVTATLDELEKSPRKN